MTKLKFFRRVTVGVASEQRLPVFVEDFIYLTHIIILMLNEIRNYYVADRRTAERVTCRCQKFLRLFVIEFKRNGKGKRSLFAGLIVFAIANFGKVTAVDACAIINRRIFFAALVNQLQKLGGKTFFPNA